jgi:hypothetical protein
LFPHLQEVEVMSEKLGSNEEIRAERTPGENNCTVIM